MTFIPEKSTRLIPETASAILLDSPEAILAQKVTNFVSQFKDFLEKEKKKNEKGTLSNVVAKEEWFRNKFKVDDIASLALKAYFEREKRKKAIEEELSKPVGVKEPEKADLGKILGTFALGSLAGAIAGFLFGGKEGAVAGGMAAGEGALKGLATVEETKRQKYLEELQAEEERRETLEKERKELGKEEVDLLDLVGELKRQEADLEVEKEKLRMAKSKEDLERRKSNYRMRINNLLNTVRRIREEYLRRKEWIEKNILDENEKLMKLEELEKETILHPFYLGSLKSLIEHGRSYNMIEGRDEYAVDQWEEEYEELINRIKGEEEFRKERLKIIEKARELEGGEAPPQETLPPAESKKTVKDTLQEAEEVVDSLLTIDEF